MYLKNNFSYGDLLYGLGNREEPQTYLLKNGFQDIKSSLVLSDQYNILIGINKPAMSLQPNFYNLFLQIYNFLGKEKNEFKLDNFDKFLDFDGNLEHPQTKGRLTKFPHETCSYRKYAISWAKAIGKYPQKFNDGEFIISAYVYYLIIIFLCKKNISHFVKRGKKIHFILDGIKLEPYINKCNIDLLTAFHNIDSFSQNENTDAFFDSPKIDPENKRLIDKIGNLIDSILIQIPSVTIWELIECYQLYNLDYTYRNNIKFYRKQEDKHRTEYVESSPPWISNKDQWHALLLKLRNSEFRSMSILMDATIVCFNNYIKKQIGSKEEDAYVRKFVTNMLKVSLSTSRLKKAFKCIYQLISDYGSYGPEKCFFAEMLFEYLWRYKENFLYFFRGVANFSIQKPGSPICHNMYNIFTNIRNLSKKDFQFSIKKRPKDDFYMGLRSRKYLENSLIDNNYKNLKYYSDSNGFIYAK
ncbi:hypothetical protein FRA_41c09760 [Francisella sp. W12-1067]|nr:hypothetical protein FRA_41c09760 [Francisella sp. W12-1067]